MRMSLGLVLLVSYNTGCATRVAPTEEPVVGVRENPPVRVTMPLAQCVPERVTAWTSEQRFSNGAHPAYFGVSPNSGLIYRESGYYRASANHHRASTGDVVPSAQLSRIESRDRDWQRQAILVDLDSTPVGLRVESTITHRTIFQTGALDPARPWIAATLTADGDTVIAAACMNDRLQINSWRVDTGEGTGEASIPGECVVSREYGPRLVALDESNVLVASPIAGTLFLADLSAHAVTQVAAHAGTASTGERGEILAIAVHPDHSRVVTVGTDSLLRTWSLPGLEPIGAPLAAGFGRVNENLYAPQFNMSPASWSVAGDLLAYVTADGDVALRTTDGRTTATLPTPLPIEPESRRRNPPTEIAFSRDGTFIAVSYEHSLAVWACPGFHWPQRRDALTVTLEGTRAMPAGAMGSWIATHIGTDHVHSHQFFIDGVAELAPSGDRDLHWTASSSGRHTIAVEIDDGVDFGRASLDVDVQP